MAARPISEAGYTTFGLDYHGHSLGVAAAMCVADAIPEEIADLILLSVAYEGKRGNAVDQISLFQIMRIIASSFFRPFHQAFECYREGKLGMDDPLSYNA